MKKSLLIITTFMCVTGTADAANIACLASACDDSKNYTTIDHINKCTMKTATCYGDNKVYSCLTCPSGYTKLQKTTGALASCNNTATFDICVETCTTSNCVSDTTWSAASTGYEKKVTRSCASTTECKATTTRYRCAAGYYGSSTNGISGCTRCPASGGVYGTSDAGSTAITACYLPSGTSFSDSTGSGTYSGNCYYSN